MRKTQENHQKGKTAVQRLLCLVLCLVMCAQMLPVTRAFAAEADTEPAAEEKKGLFQKLGDLVQTAKADETSNGALIERSALLTTMDRNVYSCQFFQRQLESASRNYASEKEWLLLGGSTSAFSDARNCAQQLLNYVEEGNTYFSGYSDFASVQTKLRGYVTDLTAIYDYFVSSYDNLKSKYNTLSGISSSSYRDMFMAKDMMDRVLGNLPGNAADLQIAILQLNEIISRGSMADSGVVTVTAPGAEATAEEALANMDAYGALLQKYYKDFLKTGNDSETTLKREIANRVVGTDAPNPSPADRYTASLERYWTLRMPEDDEDLRLQDMLQNLLTEMQNDLRTAEQKCTDAQKGYWAGSDQYEALEKLKQGIRNVVNAAISTLKLKLEMMGVVAVETMSYSEAKSNLDAAYNKLNGVILAASSLMGKCSNTAISQTDAENYLSSLGISKGDDVEPLLSELKTALATVVLGSDANGKRHLSQYIKDLTTQIQKGLGTNRPYEMPTDLAGLFAMQMADLYAGEWQMLDLPWNGTAVNAMSTYQLPVKNTSTQIDPETGEPIVITGVTRKTAYEIVCEKAYSGLEEILREMARRASMEEKGDGTLVKITTDANTLDFLRTKAQTKEDAHLVIMDQWIAVNGSTFTKKDDKETVGVSSDYAIAYAKEALNTLLTWRAAQDAYNLYQPYSAAWELLPGVAQTELSVYQQEISDYITWQENRQKNYTPIEASSSGADSTYKVYNEYCVKYMGVQLNILETMSGSVDEQIEQTRTYQNSRFSPYSDEALAVQQSKGTDMRTYLRGQLAELRVWDTALRRTTLPNTYASLISQNSAELTQKSMSGYFHAVVAQHEAESLYPLIHQYLEELESQYAKYNHSVSVNENIKVEMPTTTKTPQEVKDSILTKGTELSQLNEAVRIDQEQLDECIAYLGTDNEQYNDCLAALTSDTEQRDKVQEEYDTLKLQLIYACLTTGKELINMINSDTSLYQTYVAALKSAAEGAADIKTSQVDTNTGTDTEKVYITPGDTSKYAILRSTNDAGYADDVTEDETEPMETDQHVRTKDDYAEALLNLQEAIEIYAGGGIKYDPFPDFSVMTEAKLREEISDYQAEIETILEECEDRYNSMMSAYARYTATTELVEQAWQYQNVMTLAQNFADESNRVESLYGAIAEAEAAIKRLTPPATEEEAEQRFKEAFMVNYYAQREYLEFQQLEMALINGEYNALDTLTQSQDALSSVFHLACWKDQYSELNGTAAAITQDLSGQLDKLKKAADLAEQALWGDGKDNNYAAYYLASREISKEVLLSGDSLTKRVEEVETALDKAEAAYNSVSKSMKFADTVSLSSDYFDIYKSSPYHATKRLSVLSAIAQDKNIYDFVFSPSNTTYIESYLEYEMCKARYSDPDGVRESILNRMEVMEDQYALQVDTGATPGKDKILFFSVDYRDTEGFERKEYIFPNLDAEDQNQKILSTLTDLNTMVNQEHIDIMSSLGQSGSSSVPTESLDSWSTDTFMFTTQYDMAENGLIGFEAFGENVKTSRNFGNGGVLFSSLFENAAAKSSSDSEIPEKNSWSCRGMRLYHVDDVFGGSVYGYGGSDVTRTKLEFMGRQIGALNNFDYSISWSCDKMFNFSDSSSEFTIDTNTYDYRTEKVGEGSYAGNIVAVSDEESEYLFKLDLADVYGAGIEPLVTRYSDNGHTDTLADGAVQISRDDSSISPKILKAGLTPINPGEGTYIPGVVKPSDYDEKKDSQPAAEETSEEIPEDVSTYSSSVQPCTIADLGLPECLTYTLVYLDSNDCRHVVRVPVVTSSLAWAVQHKGVKLSDAIFGYAQQGDSLVFSAYLPDMKELKLEESYLCFEAVDGWAPSKNASSTSKTHIAERLAMLHETVSQEKTLSDGTKTTEMMPRDSEIRLTGMQIYAPGTYTASVTLDNGVIKPTVEGEPAYYFVSSTNEGESYAYGKNVPLTNLLDNYTEGVPLKPSENSTKYMVVISTDVTSLSATMDSPTISVEYVSKSGRVVTSVAEDVSTSSRDYYGYWPGVDNEDITADISTGESGQLKMLFDIDDLNYFSKIKINMDSTARDDWQITKVEILALDSFGERIGTWVPVESKLTGKILSDRVYDRVFTGDLILSKEETVLIQPGDTKEIIIHGDNARVEEQEDVDWEEKRYYMDLDTAMSDLGFSKERANYTVKVKVAGESDANTIDGDCGSVNPFYFQLVFANGKSGYVLANQQLSGDGFRTGYNETFTICTNRDYGELKSVRIIPDDMSSNSDTFDKMNIDSIEVSRQSNEAVNRTWVVNNVGWIQFDYHDEAESYSVSGREGRAEGNLARNFNVNYSTYSTKLLFTIGTSEPEANTDKISDLTEGMDEATAKAAAEALTAHRQFQGEVSLNLTYRDTKGNVQHETFDMVQAMAAYANKKITTQESTDENGEIDQSETISDTSYMFRMGHTDRFELEVRDAVQLLNASIIATGVADQSCFWKISSFGVSMITEAGMLNINHNNEYEKTNAATAEEVTSAMGLPYTMWVPARHTEEFQFYFNSNEIHVDLDENTWEVAATRVPDSDNDVANVYVYLSDDSAMPQALMGRIRYTNGFGLAYQSALREMVPMNGVKGFYANGIDVSGMAVLNNLFLDTLDAGTKNVTIDHVVIQQVRSDVVISTYTCYFNEIQGSMSDGGQLTIYPGGTSNQGSDVTYDENSQVLTIGFGENTESARLVPENRDIAVAIRYTTTNDSSDREYNSPYIYLTDQQVKTIAAGSTAEITFHEPYVKMIKGIVVLATGKIKAEFQSASVGVYEKGNDEEDKCVCWYSFGNEKDGTTLNSSPQTFKANASSTIDTIKNRLFTVTPLTVSFTTGTTEFAPDPQTSDPIRMVVSYVDAQGVSKTKTFNNIRNALVEGGFGAGETATIRVMLMGVDKLTDITVEPYSADERKVSTDDWYLSSLNLKLDKGMEEYRYSTAVERGAVQNTPLTIRALKVKMVVTAKTDVLNSDGTVVTHIAASDAAPIDLTVKPGQEVRMTVKLNSVSQTYTLQAVRVSDNTDVSSILRKNSAGEDVFAVSAITGTTEKYQLTFTAKTDSTVSETVTITVSNSSVAPEKPQQTMPFNFMYFNAMTQSYESIHDVTIGVGGSVTVKSGNASYPAGSLQWNFGNASVATLEKSADSATVKITGVAPGEINYVTVSSDGKTEKFTVHVKNPSELV